MKRREKQASGNDETCGRGHAKVSKKRLIECCKKSQGIVSMVAQMLGIDWHTAQKYINRIPEAKTAFESSREAICDLAESRLLQIVNNPAHPRHFEGVKFLLETVGKSRGYSAKVEQEIHGTNEAPPLNIVIEK